MEDSSLLGPVIKVWFKTNEWPQSVSEGLARAKGWEYGPWASQISICMAGRLTPKPPFFMALGMFNQAVAERDFVGVTDRRLMDRLMAGQPICHDNGLPWGAVDFFACYIGQLKAPISLTTPAQPITQEDVDYFVEEIRSGWRELVLVSMNPNGPAAVWNKLAEACIALGTAPEDLDYCQELLSGLREMSIAEKKRFAVKYPTCPLLKAIRQETEACGGSTARLDKFHAWHMNKKKQWSESNA